MATRAAPVASSEASDAARVAAARAAVARNPHWYHTLELAPGVLTPGRIDLRRVAARLLPEDLSGVRALDVGTFDGFWAFEMEKRGAEVVAIDVDAVSSAQLPPHKRARLEHAAAELGVELGLGFRLAAEVMGAKARRITCDVLELTPERIGGPVEVAFMGALLIHLRDPVLALERVLGTLVPGGRLIQLEGVSVALSVLHPRRPVAHLQTLSTPFNWWYPNRAALTGWLRTAGFEEIARAGFYRPPQRPPMRAWYCALRSRRPR